MTVIRHSLSIYLLSVLFAISIPIVCIAQETNSIKSDGEESEDLLSGFDDFSDIENKPIESRTAKSSWWELDGFLRLDSSYNYSHDSPESGQPDYRSLSKLRTTIQLEIPIRLPNSWKGFISGQAFYDSSYSTKNRSLFTDEVLDLYEKEAELREVYLEGPLLSNLDIKLGRQIVTWGFIDYVRVVDVLNPLDNREPGLVDIEDLRLPIAMSRVDYYYKNWSLTGLAVHEIKFNKDPEFNSDFFPSDQKPPHEIIPATNLENTEYGFALTGKFSGWDLGLYYAHVFDDTYYLDTRPHKMSLHHSSINMTGLGSNFVRGNWIFKTELAFLDGFKFSNIPGKTRSRWDAVLGIDYSGFSDTTITLEAVNRHINNFNSALEQAPDYALHDLTQYIITYRGDFMRQQLHVIAQASLFGVRAHQGNMQRYNVDYDLYDACTLTLGILNFHSGNDFRVMKFFKDNDRLFFGIKYSF